MDEQQVVNDSSVTWIHERWSTKAPPPSTARSFDVLRVPFDHAVSHRPGARLGPEAVLRNLRGYSCFSLERRVDIAGAWFQDRGSVAVVHSLPDTYGAIAEAVRSLPGTSTTMVVGGDHSISDPIHRGLAARLGEAPALIVFDAHLDNRPPLPGREHSGHWVYTLQDVARYERAAQLGINAPIYGRHQLDWAERRGVLVRSPYQIRRQGWASTLRDVFNHVGNGPVHLSIDIDVLNQGCAPGTSVPNATGLMGWEVADAVFEIACACNVVAIDLCEISPPLDSDDMTSRLGATLLHDFVAGVMSRGARAPSKHG